MTHLVFIHGINNHKYFPSNIRASWWSFLVEGWRQHNFGPIPDPPKITVGYYAQRLYAACYGNIYLQEDLNRELPELDLDKVITLAREKYETSGNGVGLLQEYASRQGVAIPSEEIRTQGIIRRNLIRLGDILEGMLPPDVSKNLTRKYLAQAAVYCDRIGLRNGIERQIMELISGISDPMEPIENLSDEPIVLVTHSLGTVVGYRMLFNPAAQRAEIPLFITLGSPLSLKFMQKSLDQQTLKFTQPPVEKWINIHDAEDFVTLGDSLAQQNIGFPGIANYGSGEYANGDGRHDIRPHLKAREASKAIYEALTNSSV